MTKEKTTTWIRPLEGIELPGIPASGADVPVALADEWLAAGLVTTEPADDSPTD